jgi:L-aminopeptidase/D-esterase-like protein
VKILLLAVACIAWPTVLPAQTRARDLGIPFDGEPGPLNAITDVTGVEVGHATLIRGEGPLVVGQGPVRTGVTAVHPRGRASTEPVFAAWFSLNGNGEMTGTAWVDESGELAGPVMITNTHSVGVVRDAVVEWMAQREPETLWFLPVVAETYDGDINDINGFHVRPEHAVEALESARGGAVEEGAVGGGTGMACNGFKGGIGTASRRLDAEDGGYTVGALVQCNYGFQDGLLIAGIPVGRELAARGIHGHCWSGEGTPSREWIAELPECREEGADAGTVPSQAHELGSIIIVVATDAPLLPHQLERVVKRAALGIARDGAIASNGSGDLFLAFSTAQEDLGESEAAVPVHMLPNDRMTPLFRATALAVEEAVVNAMVAAESMTGADGMHLLRLPHAETREVLEAHGRLEPMEE